MTAPQPLPERTGDTGPLVPGPCDACSDGCNVVGGPCAVGEQDTPEARAHGIAPWARDAYSPPTPGELLAYDDGPEPMRMVDRVLGLVVLAPWSLAVVGWSWGVVAHEVVRVVRGR